MAVNLLETVADPFSSCKCPQSGQGQDALDTDESKALLTKAPKLPAIDPLSVVFRMSPLLKCRLRQSAVGNCALAYVMKAVTVLMFPKHLFADPSVPFGEKAQRPE